MKELSNEEVAEICGGGISELGEWVINGVGDLICQTKSAINKVSSFFGSRDYSLLKNYSHGTYPGNF